MKDVDDSRIITFSCLSSFIPIPEVGAYILTKQALDGWVKQWNVEREWLKQIHGEYVYKTLAISCQPSFVNTSMGSLPPSLCNPVAPFPFFQYPSGLPDIFNEPMFLGQLGLLGNSGTQNLEKEQVGQAVLYMSTVPNPEWQYVVLNDHERFCFGEGTTDVKCLLEKLSQHKVRDNLTKVIRGYNYRAAYDNILNGGNTEKYSVYNCPPFKKPAPAIPVPPLPAEYPGCEGGNIPDLLPNVTDQDNVIDLYQNACKPDNPC